MSWFAWFFLLVSLTFSFKKLMDSNWVFYCLLSFNSSFCSLAVYVTVTKWLWININMWRYIILIKAHTTICRDTPGCSNVRWVSTFRYHAFSRELIFVNSFKILFGNITLLLKRCSSTERSFLFLNLCFIILKIITCRIFL